MSEWCRLIEYQEKYVQRGALLRFAAGQSFEDHVVMMVCEAPGDSGRSALMTITGYKAGINCYVAFPAVSQAHPLSIEWLINNWTHWVWPEGDVAEVEIREPLSADEI
jgi:hypothetical protein